VEVAAGDTSGRNRRQRIFRDCAVVAVALTVGFGVSALVNTVRDRGGRGHASEGRSLLGARSGRNAAAGYQPPATAANGSLSIPSSDNTPAPAAPTPRAAIETFLDLEVKQDFAASFGSLSAPDRLKQRTRPEWVAEHDHLSPITGYTITGIDGSTVRVDLQLRAGIDYVRGLTPAHATAAFSAVPEDGGFRIAYASSAVTPSYPPDAGAVAAAQSWADGRQACGHPAELAGGLLGATYLAAALCGASGAVAVGAVGALPDSPAVEPLLAAFGPDVGRWARVVPVSSPVQLSVVTAPVGESWLVIGVLAASPGTGN
jgi:hypothetical protein